MQNEADNNGCILRPHIKTHKTPYLAKLQVGAGACGITSCKVSEAEVMADNGFDDIFIAYPLVGARKLERACALSKRIKRLILAIDNLAQAEPLALAAQTHNQVLEVRIEVDCGGGRTGAELKDFEPLVTFVEQVPGLKLTGLYTFRGLNGGIADPEGSAPAGGRFDASICRDRRENLWSEIGDQRRFHPHRPGSGQIPCVYRNSPRDLHF